MRLVRSILLMVSLVTGLGPVARAGDLLRLVPPDAGAVVEMESLRVHWKEFHKSPFSEGLFGLPAVKAWLASDGFRQFRQSREEIERVLGVDLTRVRDDLFGDSVVLALHLADGDAPDRAKGLLLTRVRDRALLERLIGVVNAAETADGTLVKVSPLRHADHEYFVREFRAGTKPTEYYAVVDPDVLAWSNSEALLRGVLERQRGSSPGLSGSERFRAVRSALPDSAPVRLFMDPRLLERVIAASPKPESVDDDRGRAAVASYLAAVDYVGAGVEWRDGIVVHVHQTIDPAKVVEPLRRWAAQAGGPAALLRRVPASAVGVAAAHVHPAALHDAVVALLSPNARANFDNLVTAIQGVLLGEDLRASILPRLGPGVVAYADAPPSKSDVSRFPLVFAVAVDDAGKSVPAAIENALRTALALSALGPKVKDLGLRVVTEDRGGVRVSSLSGGGSRPCAAFAVGPGAVVFGSSPEAVARFFETPKSAGPNVIERFRHKHMGDVESFAYLDLIALQRVARTSRPFLTKRLVEKGRSEADARRDFEQAMALMDLFRASYVTAAVDPSFRSMHHTFGLLAREPARP